MNVQNTNDMTATFIAVFVVLLVLLLIGVGIWKRASREGSKTERAAVIDDPMDQPLAGRVGKISKKETEWHSDYGGHDGDASD